MAEIQGLESFLKKLRELPEGAMSKGQGPLNNAMRKGANVWKQAASDRVRGIGPGKKSGRLEKIGRLADNIRVSKDSDPESNGFTHRYSVSYGRAFWGRFVELGSEAFNDGREYPKHPFLRPAFDSTQGKVLSEIGKQLERDIARVVRSL